MAKRRDSKPTAKPPSRTDGPDIGEFTLGHPDEQMLMLQLWELAAKNTEFPGTAHLRMVANDPATGKQMGIKSYHLDANQKRLVVLEEHEGRVTARRTLPLKPFEADRGPPAMDPGPEAASFERTPLRGMDLDIDEEPRDWAMQGIDDRLPGLGAVVATVRLLSRHHHDAYIPAQPCLPANVSRLGATVARLRAREGVERVLVEGWLDTGEAQGLAFVFEAATAEGWWLATRNFRRRAGGIGEFSGPWSFTEPPANLPMALRALHTPLPAATAYDTGEPQVPAAPPVNVDLGQLRADQELPVEPEGWAALAASPFERDVLAQKGFHAPRVVVFRGRNWERWNLDEELPTDVDDVIRNICQRGTEPSAVVLVHFGVVPVDGAAYEKCLLATAEAGGRRHTRAMQLRFDAGGRVVTCRYLRAEPGKDPDDLWIGVEPLTRLTTELAHPAGEA